MKPLNLREFAEALALGDNREFAKEILDNLDFVEKSEYEELCEDLTHISETEFKGHSPRKQVDRIGDRVSMFEEILDTLDRNKMQGDPDDAVRDLAELSLALRNVLGLDTTSDIYETVARLLEDQKEYDL